jgi:hypothetical protein
MIRMHETVIVVNETVNYRVHLGVSLVMKQLYLSPKQLNVKSLLTSHWDIAMAMYALKLL